MRGSETGIAKPPQPPRVPRLRRRTGHESQPAIRVSSFEFRVPGFRIRVSAIQAAVQNESCTDRYSSQSKNSYFTKM